MALSLSDEDRSLLQCLEEKLWLDETRFDNAYMERVLAADFFEFGRSGRIYQREDIISAPGQTIDTVIPLPDFDARLLSSDIALVTYNSRATFDGVLEKGRRSSIWSRAAEGWILRFHQGTPYEDE